MNEYKPLVSPSRRENSDNGTTVEPLAIPRDVSDLPVSNWDDYKNWCEKVKQNWDVN
jgi:hypothetical protein